MVLLEIDTGYMGESYERMYVWDVDEAAAKEQAKPYLAKKGRQIRSTEVILSSDTKPQMFALSGSGFGAPFALE